MNNRKVDALCNTWAGFFTGTSSSDSSSLSLGGSIPTFAFWPLSAAIRAQKSVRSLEIEERASMVLCYGWRGINDLVAWKEFLRSLFCKLCPHQWHCDLSRSCIEDCPAVLILWLQRLCGSWEVDLRLHAMPQLAKSQWNILGLPETSSSDSSSSGLPPPLPRPLPRPLPLPLAIAPYVSLLRQPKFYQLCHGREFSRRATAAEAVPLFLPEASMPVNLVFKSIHVYAEILTSYAPATLSILNPIVM